MPTTPANFRRKGFLLSIHYPVRGVRSRFIEPATASRFSAFDLLKIRNGRGKFPLDSAYFHPIPLDSA
jgi:hypothetical protein